MHARRYKVCIVLIDHKHANTKQAHTHQGDPNQSSGQSYRIPIERQQSRTACDAIPESVRDLRGTSGVVAAVGRATRSAYGGISRRVIVTRDKLTQN